MLKLTRELLVHTSSICPNQLMCNMLVCFRNHTPIECVTPLCIQTLSYVCAILGDMVLV